MIRRVFQSRSRRSKRYRSTYSSSRIASAIVKTTIYLCLLLCVWAWVVLFTQGELTVRGVPTSIIISFLQDETARTAYFEGDSKKLHDRLEAMGMEERIKAFYRPKIRNEAKLDQHIHQILYDLTGYVGVAYRVNSQGVLVLKRPK